MLPGLRLAPGPCSMSSRFVPLQQRPDVVASLPLRPAASGTSPTSGHHRLDRVLNPTISISSPTFTMLRSTRPVTTAPRPEIMNTSSTVASGTVFVDLQRFRPLRTYRTLPAASALTAHRSPTDRSSSAFRRALSQRMIGVSSPGYLHFDRSSRSSISTRTKAPRPLSRPRPPCSGKRPSGGMLISSAQENVLVRLRHRTIRS